ncbi:MAG: DEAD/DEAH box helicase [Thermoleophilaceae bacterium]
MQELVLPDVLAGRDVLVKSPTGSGKTLAFGIPMIERLEASARRPAALVLAPTRELALQIVDELTPIAHARALSVAPVYGGVGFDKQIKAARKAHVLVATPGRLEDLIAQQAIRLDCVRILVIDEADRMLDMGFRPAVDRIVALTPRERQTLFFSATLEGDAGRVASEYTRKAGRHEYAPPGSTGVIDVDHRFVAVPHEERLDRLVTELGETDRGRTLVFVRTKRGADRLVKRLRGRGHEAVAMHGDKSQSQRERALRSFHAGDASTLVATDVAARGIDVDDVTHVINFDAPGDRDTYVHRVGRTGRAGRGGVGITFVTRDQVDDIRDIARELQLHKQFERRGHKTDGRHKR